MLEVVKEIRAIRPDAVVNTAGKTGTPNVDWCETHHLALDGSGKIASIRSAAQQDLRINGGFFIFRSEIFRYIKEGEELLLEPFHRLLDEGKLCAYRYDGFWMPMDTFKDREHLDDMTRRGHAPWEVWR